MFTIVEKELFRWRRVRKNGREMSICTKLLVVGQIVFSSINIAIAGITEPHVNLGSATFTQPNAYTTNVNQSTQLLDVTCKSISTVKDESINVLQLNATSTAIFRAIGGVPSEFRGALNANGRVFILNESGITFFGTSQVNVGALIATTAKDVNVDGDHFSFSGGGYGQVINHGNIHVSNSGFAVLAAPYVENTGTIQANLGQIQLASAKDFTVDLRGDGLIDFTVTKETMDAIANDAKLGVTNTGTLQAQSGTINITAGLASDIVQSVVNLGGVVDADAFSAGYNGGTVLVTSVGDINNTASIHADGGVDGNGGTIKTWADGTNRFDSEATMSARGGNDGGDGGFVEVSGNHVALRGNVDVAAPNGKVGTLLIDPTDLTIKDGAGINGTDTVYENNVEVFVGNLVLEASHSITLDDLVTDHVLQRGNNGALELKVTDANGVISFVNTNDTIATTGNNADITLSAGSGGIHIGNLSTGGPGVSNPGVISLTTTNGGDIATKNITITADGAEGAAAYLSANATGSLTTGNISVTADANSTSYSTYASAEADLIAGSNITVVGDAKVKATAKSTYGDANATARLLAAAGVKSVIPTDTGGTLTFGTGSLNITGDVHVNADALSTYNSANASAEAFLLAGNNVDITTGPTTLQVTANATTNWGDANADAVLLAAAGVSSLSADEGEGNYTVNAAFGTGTLTINGNIDVTADAATTYEGDATAMAAAILAAGDDVNIDTYGMLNVAATAWADGSSESSGGSATAIAGLVALAGLDTITVSESTGSTPSVTMTASSGNLDITGDIHVSADATVGSSGSGNALAGAAAILAAGNNVNIDTDTDVDTLEVAASATNVGYGEADAGAALVVAAGIASLGFSEDGAPTVTYGNGDLTIWGNILVQAEAWESSGLDGGNAAAFANLLAAGGTDHTFVHDDITVTASADHSEVNVGDLKTIGNGADIRLAAWNAEDTGDGNNGTVNAGNLKTIGAPSYTYNGYGYDEDKADITVDAGNGGIHTGNLSTGGHDEGIAHPGDIRLTTTNGGNINTGNISIIAEGTDSASAYLNVSAFGNFDAGSILVQATDYYSSAHAEAQLDADGHIQTAGITVAADGAEGTASAILVADAGGYIDTGPVSVLAYAHDGYWDGGAYADANADLNAGGSITVNGDITVKADATGASADTASANATLNAHANGEGEGLKITGGVLVEANAAMSGEWGSNAKAKAYANLTAQNDIVIGNGIAVKAMAQNSASSESGFKADADASLEMTAGNDLKVGGNVLVSADATLSNGTDDADAYAYADLWADRDLSLGNGITVAATANTAKGSDASGTAELYAYAGRDLIINGDVSVSAIAHGTGATDEADANADADLGAGRDLTVNGNIKVRASALLGENGNSSAYADANAYLGAGRDLTVNGRIDVLADANNDGAEGYANAYLTAQAENDLTIRGDIMVKADATVGEKSTGSADAYAYASADLSAGRHVTILTDPVTISATADNQGHENDASADAHLYVRAGTADGGEGGVTGDLYITGDISATATASGGSYNQGSATIDLSATGDITNLYGTTPPKAYAPNPDDPAHALVQVPAHWAEHFSESDGEETPFFASVDINADGTVTIEPKSVAPSGCGRDECEVNNALEARRVDPIEPLPTGRDPLRIAQDGLVLWPTGAGVTVPSTGAIVTADMQSAIAAGADPTTLLPATAAGGMGLSAGLDAFSIGGSDYCDQVVSGFCLPAVGEKAKQ